MNASSIEQPEKCPWCGCEVRLQRGQWDGHKRICPLRPADAASTSEPKTRRVCPSCLGIGKQRGTNRGRPAQIRCVQCKGWGTIATNPEQAAREASGPACPKKYMGGRAVR